MYEFGAQGFDPKHDSLAVPVYRPRLVKTLSYMFHQNKLLRVRPIVTTPCFRHIRTTPNYVLSSNPHHNFRPSDSAEASLYDSPSALKRAF